MHTHIIGGGIIGLTTALALRQRGATVTLHEADTLFSGASLGNAGHLASEYIYPVANLAILPKLPLLLATPLAILWLTTLPAVQEKTRRYPATYHHPANLACGLTLLILAYYNLSHDGNAAPFPYLPVLNPLELVSLVALYILWRRHVVGTGPGDVRERSIMRASRSRSACPFPLRFGRKTESVCCYVPIDLIVIDGIRRSQG